MAHECVECGDSCQTMERLLLHREFNEHQAEDFRTGSVVLG